MSGGGDAKGELLLTTLRESVSPVNKCDSLLAGCDCNLNDILLGNRTPSHKHTSARKTKWNDASTDLSPKLGPVKALRRIVLLRKKQQNVIAAGGFCHSEW